MIRSQVDAYPKVSRLAIVIAIAVQSYTLEKVDLTYEREWDGEAVQMTPKVTITPLKAELDQAFAAYAQWVAQNRPLAQETDEGEVIA